MSPVECSQITLAMGTTQSNKNVSTDSLKQQPKKERATPSCAGCSRHVEEEEELNYTCFV